MLLRAYQATDVDALRVLFRTHRRVCYQLATGAGKTPVVACVAHGAVAKGLRVWVVTHRRELLRQASQKLTLFDVPHGLIQAGITPDPHQPVQVLSVQTAIRRLEKLGPVDLIIPDECHHATSRSWRRILESRPHARILGVTATPTRTDGSGLSDVFDALHCGPDMQTLTAQGYLAPYRAFVPPQVANLQGVPTRMGDYATAPLAERMGAATVTGDAVGHYGRLARGLPALAFCVSVQHATDTAAAFRAAGFRFEVVDGSLPDAVRDSRLAALASGALDGLTSCDIISEGVDVPAVTAAILLRPTQSLILHLQTIGRCLRPAPGKTAIILDHAGNLARHGFPDDPREWTLEGTRTRRRAALPAIQTCRTCFAAFRAGVVKCPQCGAAVRQVRAARRPDVVAGELSEMTAAERAVVAAKKERSQRLALEAISRKRGYSKGWVDYVMAARTKNKATRAIDFSGRIKQWKGEEA